MEKTQNKILYRSNGNYLGFIQDDIIFNRDGIPLGWMEGNFAWDVMGKFRGNLIKTQLGRDDTFYVWLNKFSLLPLQRSPRVIQPVAPLRPTTDNIPPINPPVGWIDAFE